MSKRYFAHGCHAPTRYHAHDNEGGAGSKGPSLLQVPGIEGNSEGTNTQRLPWIPPAQWWQSVALQPHPLRFIPRRAPILPEPHDCRKECEGKDRDKIRRSGERHHTEQLLRFAHQYATTFVPDEIKWIAIKVRPRPRGVWAGIGCRVQADGGLQGGMPTARYSPSPVQPSVPS